MIGAAILHSARQNVVLLSKTLFYSAEHCSVRQNDFREPEVPEYIYIYEIYMVGDLCFAG